MKCSLGNLDLPCLKSSPYMSCRPRLSLAWLADGASTWTRLKPGPKVYCREAASVRGRHRHWNQRLPWGPSPEFTQIAFTCTLDSWFSLAADAGEVGAASNSLGRRFVVGSGGNGLTTCGAVVADSWCRSAVLRSSWPADDDDDDDSRDAWCDRTHLLESRCRQLRLQLRHQSVLSCITISTTSPTLGRTPGPSLQRKWP